jgi:hypothetical protein
MANTTIFISYTALLFFCKQENENGDALPHPHQRLNEPDA